LLFLAGLLLGFWISFPVGVVQQRLVAEIERQLPIEVTLDQISLRPWLTLAGRNAKVEFDNLPDYRLAIDAFRIGPWWRSLFSVDPGVQARFESVGGRCDVHLQKSGRLLADASNLLLKIPLATTPVMTLSAALTSARVETATPLQTTTTSLFSLDAADVSVGGLGALFADAETLSLGRVWVKATGRGRALSIEQLTASGGALAVTGKGHLLLGANAASSRVNLTLNIRSTAAANSNLAALLQLVGPQQPDGSYRLRVTGTVARPVISQSPVESGSSRE
jgi:type II secretion system protein N